MPGGHNINLIKPTQNGNSWLIPTTSTPPAMNPKGVPTKSLEINGDAQRANGLANATAPGSTKSLASTRSAGQNRHHKVRPFPARDGRIHSARVVNGSALRSLEGKHSPRHGPSGIQCTSLGPSLCARITLVGTPF